MAVILQITELSRVLHENLMILTKVISTASQLTLHNGKSCIKWEGVGLSVAVSQHMSMHILWN
jgi:hypothetical protein